ncbi:MAG: efflux RND transporter periplasmic adaptor subunit [Hyphomicrobium sp.]|nr:efflux RND transporter periplasmic adaptor subunit [Hyphomicrobium sp.]
MLNKVNPTVITLGIAGILAIAVGFYVNSVSWGPVAEEKTTQATSSDAKKPANDVTTAAMRPTWAASATGRVEPKSGEVRITAEVPGRIVDIAAALNDQVKAGDVLVRLDDDDAITKVVGANAEEKVRVRERNEEDARGLQQERRNAEDAVASAERAVFGAQQEYDDALDQKRNGNGTDDAVDKARTKLDDAKKKLADQRANLASVNAKSGMPLPTRLEAALAVARAELTAAELGVEHTRIRAPFDGTVLNVIAKEGEVATPSPENTLVVFGDLSTMKVRAEVEERDAAKIRVGQRVVVRADAYPDQDFEGRVTSIAQSLSPPNIQSRGPRRPNDVEVLEAMVELDGLPPLLTGMRVDVFFKHDATASTK